MKKFKIGIVSDTHIPDRTLRLDEAFLTALKAEKVDLILHAGDICIMSVIDTLEKIAPVIVVRGNRDFLLHKQVGMVSRFDKFGIQFVMLHGHMNFVSYWFDKLLILFNGYDRNRYIHRFDKKYPDADVFVFGHTHHAENFWQNGKLFFNPGSITRGDYLLHQRSWGILEVLENGQVEGRVNLYP